MLLIFNEERRSNGARLAQCLVPGQCLSFPTSLRSAVVMTRRNLQIIELLTTSETKGYICGLESVVMPLSLLGIKIFRSNARQSDPKFYPRR